MYSGINQYARSQRQNLIAREFNPEEIIIAAELLQTVDYFQSVITTTSRGVDVVIIVEFQVEARPYDPLPLRYCVE